MPHIRLIAPSWPLPAEDVTLTKSYFEGLGLHVSVPADLLGEDLLCAHKAPVRLAHLQQALSDPSIDIIWLICGGSGLTQLIPDLLTLEKPAKDKLFIGFSDGTALHVFLNQMWNMPSLHAPCAAQIAKQKVGHQSIKATLDLLHSDLAAYSPPPLTPFNQKAQAMTALKGTVVGGNLCMLQTSLGTKWQFNPSGKILFLEDIDERGYSIDRLLVHLQQAHIFDEVQAILLGDFVRGEEADGSSLIFPVLKRFAEKTGIPVFLAPNCGHGEENFPLPFNVELSFRINKG
jgi:muramoyltetrapeptide carboxypeptidase